MSNHRHISLLVLLASLYGPLTAANSLQEATDAHDAADLPQARNALDAVLNNSERGSAVQRTADQNLAVIKAKQGDLAGAIATLEKVISTDQVSAAAFANLKALRAVQAAQSLQAAMGKSTTIPLPDLLWLQPPEKVAKPVAEFPLDTDSLDAFIADYALALGSRDTAAYLGLYSLSYAPPQGNSRAAWQLDIIGAFADARVYAVDAKLIEANSLNQNLAVVAFSLHDPRSGDSRKRSVLLHRDLNSQWKILSELTP